jgi:formamidopyrimidine-DNA glycosylase
MLELPESYSLSKQITHILRGKVIRNVTSNASPHRFAWYFGDPNNYHSLLEGKKIDGAKAVGGQVEITADDIRILLGDGVNIRYFESGDRLPVKHQLSIEFDDKSFLICSVQMYGGLWVFHHGENDNPYYLIARDKPSPLNSDFTKQYFEDLYSKEQTKNLTVKAFLATEQRIPGLGNGVLQDILYNAKIHPKRKINTLNPSETECLFDAVKSTLYSMAEKGGRDTEKDLFGKNGSYQTILSKNTVGKPCPVCGTLIKKEAYLGGSIYICEGCQN